VPQLQSSAAEGHPAPKRSYQTRCDYLSAVMFSAIDRIRAAGAASGSLLRATHLLPHVMKNGYTTQWLATFLIVVLAASGCTTVGVNTRDRTTIDYGPPITLNICLLRAPGVTEERVDELVAAVNNEFAPYKIQVVIAWQRPWTRAGFTSTSLFDDVARRDLEPPCDRLIALVDRNAGDFLWGLVMPEILGEVDQATHTRGYIVATTASLNQMFEPPSVATVHEFYHLLGCPHAASLTKCYHLIASLKAHTDAANGFVPGIDPNGQFLMTRERANATLRSAMTYVDVRRQDLTLEQERILGQTPACRSEAAKTSDGEVAQHRLARSPQAVVCVCFDETGVLTQDPVISISSGRPKIDEAAIKLAKGASGLFPPGLVDGKPTGRCLRDAITFQPSSEVSP
jgi:hypothetical protein